jgi:hypothetical protein
MRKPDFVVGDRSESFQLPHMDVFGSTYPVQLEQSGKRYIG